MTRSTDPSGTPAFCSRILEVISAEPFDLGYGINVRKTCSVGWAAYPWCRRAYEAVCAEESIELADAALYRAKALGRNRGVGFVAADAAGQNPEGINLQSLRQAKSPFVQAIETACAIDVDATAAPPLTSAHAANKIDG
jgi:predicted signal transduction protein with EAL and GGDEF domain